MPRKLWSRRNEGQPLVEANISACVIDFWKSEGKASDVDGKANLCMQASNETTQQGQTFAEAKARSVMS